MKAWLAKTAGWVVAMAVAFGAGYVTYEVLVGEGLGGSGEPSVVPDLRGLTVETARRLLEEEDLLLAVIGEILHDSVPEGVIVLQRPLSGVPAEREDEVRVVVSAGPAVLLMPDLIGMERAEAEAVLAALGIRVERVEETTSRTVPAGRLVGTDPEPWRPVEYGRGVSLTISSGSPLVEVPQVVGLRLSEAIRRLREASLRGGPPERLDEELGDPVVVMQEPVAGFLVEAGTRVVLHVEGDVGPGGNRLSRPEEE